MKRNEAMALLAGASALPTDVMLTYPAGATEAYRRAIDVLDALGVPMDVMADALQPDRESVRVRLDHEPGSPLLFLTGPPNVKAFTPVTKLADRRAPEAPTLGPVA